MISTTMLIIIDYEHRLYSFDLDSEDLMIESPRASIDTICNEMNYM